MLIKILDKSMLREDPMCMSVYFSNCNFLLQKQEEAEGSRVKWGMTFSILGILNRSLSLYCPYSYLPAHQYCRCKSLANSALSGMWWEIGKERRLETAPSFHSAASLLLGSGPFLSCSTLTHLRPTVNLTGPGENLSPSSSLSSWQPGTVSSLSLVPVFYLIWFTVTWVAGSAASCFACFRERGNWSWTEGEGLMSLSQHTFPREGLLSVLLTAAKALASECISGAILA